eukprot:GHVS01062292.1.p1 GENE.GHVS01062292.1~~GHVS01062292.1.p1  ORF type:complete len:315 (+),score=42.77 GHVS01062292.1:262-1206(+)
MTRVLLCWLRPCSHRPLLPGMSHLSALHRSFSAGYQNIPQQPLASAEQQQHLDTPASSSSSLRPSEHERMQRTQTGNSPRQTSNGGASGGDWRNARREGGGPWEGKGASWDDGVGRDGRQRYSSQYEEPRREGGPRGYGNQQSDAGRGSEQRMQDNGRSSPYQFGPPRYQFGSTMMLVRPSPALFMDEEGSGRKRYKCLVDGTVSFVFMRRKPGNGRRFDKDRRVVFCAKPADLGAFLAPLPRCGGAQGAAESSKGKVVVKKIKEEKAEPVLVEVGRAENREEKQTLRVYLPDELHQVGRYPVQPGVCVCVCER